MWSTAKAVLVCACLAASLAILISSIPAYPNAHAPGYDICEYNKDTNHEDCTRYSLAPFIFIQIAKTLNRYGETVTALATVAVACFTGTLWWATLRLWKAALDQSADFKASITAAERSADAMALIASANRAWMTYDDLQIVFLPDSVIDGIPEVRGLGFRIMWRNIGRSPALNAEIFIQHHVVDVADRNVPHFEADFGENRFGAAIGPRFSPGSPMRAVGTIGHDNIMNRNSAVILYSCIRYTDIYNLATERLSEVCLRITFEGFRLGAPSPQQPNWGIEIVGPQNAIT